MLIETENNTARTTYNNHERLSIFRNFEVRPITRAGSTNNEIIQITPSNEKYVISLDVKSTPRPQHAKVFMEKRLRILNNRNFMTLSSLHNASRRGAVFGVPLA